MDAIKQWIKKITANRYVAFLMTVFQRFGEENGAFYAAGLSFFLLLAFPPLILAGVAVMAFFVSDVHAASQSVTHLIEGMLPAGGARQEATRFLTERMHVDDQVRSVVQHRGVASVIGFLSLIWAAVQIFINAAVAMNAIWAVKESRNWFLLRGIALGMMILTGALLVFSLFLSGAPAAIAHYNLPIVHRLPIPLWLVTTLSEILALIVNAGMYAVAYKWLPNADTDWKSALFGGAVASVLFEIAKKGVAAYLLKANTSVYGDLANLILFVLWIYYSMTIYLLGVSFAAAFAKKASGQPGKKSLDDKPATRGERIQKSSRVQNRTKSRRLAQYVSKKFNTRLI